VGTRQIRFCDISGTEDDVETHELNIDQMHVEIDLAPAEYSKLLELLQPYVQAGRVEASARNFTAPARTRSQTPALTPAEREQLKTWAQHKGISVPPNNRFKRSIIEQWRHETLTA
jgi:hypothetical protein